MMFFQKKKGSVKKMQSINGIPIKITVPSRRYMDEFVKLKCAPDMLSLDLFPNSKEVTESLAVYSAIRKHFRHIFDLSDPNVTVISVGDGATPRTGATFAYRSAWQCISVDPLLKNKKGRFNAIQRLTMYENKIEELHFVFDKVIILHVHSHATIADSLAHIKGNERHLISMPCCVPQVHDRKPDIEYHDWGCWSPKNKIKIWRDI
jgi:hypothetical protein